LRLYSVRVVSDSWVASKHAKAIRKGLRGVVGGGLVIVAATLIRESSHLELFSRPT